MEISFVISSQGKVGGEGLLMDQGAGSQLEAANTISLYSNGTCDTPHDAHVDTLSTYV